MALIKNLPDAEVVANLLSGNRMEESIKAIYSSCFESLSNYIINNSGNQQDAEDIFQEVVVNFIDLVQKGKFRGESSIKTFLYSLNRHTWLNELKRKGRALAREEKYEKSMGGVAINTDQVIIQRETNAQLMTIVDQLGEACKKILLLFYYENRSMKEILEVMHYENEQVIRNKKSKCLKQLEQMIISKPYLKENLKNILHG